jgi:hypothetical protein
MITVEEKVVVIQGINQVRLKNSKRKKRYGNVRRSKSDIMEMGEKGILNSVAICKKQFYCIENIHFIFSNIQNDQKAKFRI